jgi:streptogramin lyase
MRKLNIRHLPLLVLMFLFANTGVRAQNIQTVAGGGPNNLPALEANLANPRATAVDSSGNTYIAAQGQNRVFKVDPSGTLTVVAGNGAPGYSGDGGPATSATLNSPYGLAVDSSGNIFIADTGNQRIREVDHSTGNITTVAGNGAAGYGGDGGPATSTSLNSPNGVAVDSFGNVFIADTGNQRIREVNASTHNISTVAGNGSASYNGDGILATSASLYVPEGVAVDGSGNIYIADTYNNRIRKVNASTHIISTVAGTGTYGYNGDGILATSATLSHPFGVAVDGSGNIYIADTYSYRIRKVDTSETITTVAGDGAYGYSGDGAAATSASLSFPFGVAVDSSGNIYIADSNNRRIRKVAISTGDITTLAGNGDLGFCGDGGPATSASLNSFYGVAVDDSGNFYIADTYNQRIRKVDASGTITTVAGNGSPSYSGDGGTATSASLSNPYGVAADGSGNLYIADTYNQRIREVDAITHDITTVAGNGSSGSSGDGGTATNASLSYPRSVAVDGSGNIYIADTSNQRIREVVHSTGNITTVAGNGTYGYSGDGGPAASAKLANPYGVAVDGSGNIYIADTDNNRIRKVDATTHDITTVAGNGTGGFSGDGGPATSATLTSPYGVAVDSSGNIFIADTFAHRIREVDRSTGNITTVAGDGTYAFSGDGGPATSAGLANPYGVAVNGAGNVYIADTSNQRIREVTVTVAEPILSGLPTSLDFGHQQAGTQSLPKTVTVSNTGSADLHVSDVSVTGDFLETNNCLSGAVSAGGSCTINVSFLPTVIGTRTGKLTITDADGSSLTVDLTGIGDYGLAGFLSPSAIVTFNIPRAVPLKWQYTDANGEVVDSSTFAPILQIYATGACGGSETAAIAVNDAGKSGYRYHSATKTWQYNWKTSGLSPGCYNIYVETGVTGQSNGGFPVYLK